MALTKGNTGGHRGNPYHDNLGKFTSGGGTAEAATAPGGIPNHETTPAPDPAGPANPNPAPEITYEYAQLSRPTGEAAAFRDKQLTGTLKGAEYPDERQTSLYHGTRADLKPGDLIEPGHPGNFVRRMKHVYAADKPEGATQYGANLYEVVPTGPVGHRADARAEMGYYASEWPLQVVRKIDKPAAAATVAAGAAPRKRAKTSARLFPPPTAADALEPQNYTDPRRTPAAIAEAQTKLDVAGYGIAETKKPIPTGKNVTLYHRTTPEKAEAIVREGFRADVPKNTPGMTAEEQQSAFFVHPQLVENWRGYGEAIVSVTVPRQVVKPDTTMPSVPPPLKVSVTDLAKARVKRIK